MTQEGGTMVLYPRDPRYLTPDELADAAQLHPRLVELYVELDLLVPVQQQGAQPLFEEAADDGPWAKPHESPIEITLSKRHGGWEANMRIFPFHHVFALLLLWIVAGIGFAAPMAEEEFHSRVVAIYSFEPHTLNKAEFEAKIIELDEFWVSVKTDPEKWLPLLKRELVEPSTDPNIKNLSWGQ